MQLDSLQLETPLWLAPLAGFTCLPYRRLLRRQGGIGLSVTELVNARSLIESNREALKLISSDKEDSPFSIQLFGAVPEEMAEAARLAEASGADVIDINMGCPAPKVVRNCSGSALLGNLPLAERIAELVVKAVKIPVTVKMRLGLDSQQIVAPHLAKILQNVGIKAITIHGRTRAQGFGGEVDLDGIASVVEAASCIPVFANGDITTPENAETVFRRTGCAGLMIGRGAFYNPFLFRQILQYHSTGTYEPEPDFETRVALMTQHLKMMIEYFGEIQGCNQFRKVAPFYTRRMGPAREFNRQFCRCSSFEHYLEIMENYKKWRLHFLDENGNLKANYQPVPIASGIPEC